MSAARKTMRILFLTDKFIPERGGSQIIFGQAYAHLPEHEVTVLTRRWQGDAACDERYPHRVVRVPYSSLPKLRSPLLWLSLVREARRLGSRRPFDQVHCGQPAETAPLGRALAARWRVPLVVHTFAEDVTTHLRHPFYGPRMRRALLSAASVTTISRYTRDHLLEMGVHPERVTLLYPGVTAEEWRSRGTEDAIRRELGVEGKRVLLTVARLIPRKGIDTVLQALPAVLARVPETAYVVVGGGPDEARLRALASRLGLDAHVRFVGSVPNSRTVEYYHACDLFVMPNREMPNRDIEGFGLVFLEANACGRPVIGGRSGGTVDAVADGETGYLVDPGSPEELAGRLINLLEDPRLARRLGEQGRARVRGEFTWARSGAVLHRVTALAAAGAPAGLGGA